LPSCVGQGGVDANNGYVPTIVQMDGGFGFYGDHIGFHVFLGESQRHDAAHMQNMRAISSALGVPERAI